VAVLKGPSGKGGVRLAIDYRSVNLHSQGDAFVLPHLLDSIQNVEAAHYISVWDARTGYWQLGMKEESIWLAAFAYDGGLYEWNRMPFGLKTSGNSFCRCVHIIVQPIRDFCYQFVDDMSVCSETWTQHVAHLRSFLTVIRKRELTLSLKKCSVAQNEVRFVGHIIGSGRHRPHEEKLATISDLAKPKTKKDVRKMIGFFNYYHSYVPQLAKLCVPFTNSLAKGKFNELVWTSVEEKAFEKLKSVLRDCVRANLYTAEWSKPFRIHCDSSKLAVGSSLVKWDDEGRQKPIAFESAKISGAQLAWAAIEKEAYAIVWLLNKF
jgi:Reverse transcriptase (RNA-dependent DNA polymerase)/RNase H-like domain found in reverse transcriptase